MYVGDQLIIWEPSLLGVIVLRRALYTGMNGCTILIKVFILIHVIGISTGIGILLV